MLFMKKPIFYILCLLFSGCSLFERFERPTLTHLWITELYQFELIVDHGDNPQSMLTIEKFNQHFQIKSDKGELVPIVKLRYLAKDRLQLITGKNLSLERNYYIVPIGGTRLYAYPERSFLNKYYYTKEFLGAKKNGNLWTLTLWSPTATDITLRLYRADDQRRLLFKLPMQRITPGLWFIELDQRKFPEGKLEGVHYLYEVFALGEKHQAPDPYSLALAPHYTKKSDDLKSTIVDIDKLKKQFVLSKSKTNKELLHHRSFLAAEAHVRDLSIAPNSPVEAKLKGTYLGAHGIIPQLKKMGVTHLQLLPTAFFPTVKERPTNFQTFLTPYSALNYNWGYDTQHFFALSGFYSATPHHGLAKIEEYKKMVSGFNQHGIGIIQDVVFNHLYDGLAFEKIAPGCYLRRDRQGKISDKSKAGYTFETRNFMARRMLIDAMDFWYNFYGVSGFRFDLMGFIDQETMQAIRKRLGDDVLLYGEGWNFSDLPKQEATTMQQLPDQFLGAFNGEARDSILGTIGLPGVVLGNQQLIPRVKSVVVGAGKNADQFFPGLSNDQFHHFTQSTQQNYIYLDIHDGPTAWDKLLHLTDLNEQQRVDRLQQAYLLLFTSMGRPIIQLGSERGRTKNTNKDDAEKHTLFKSSDGVKLLQANSYRHWDETNHYPWTNATFDLAAFIGQLMELKNLPHFKYTSTKELAKKLRFIDFTPRSFKEQKTEPLYTNFEQLEDLTIEFINGPENQTMYLAGEIHPDFQVADESKNPTSNPFILSFDRHKKAKITLSKNHLRDAALEAWSMPNALNLKAVFQPGKWETIDAAYDGLGNNAILISDISKERLITIDLSVKNHQSGLISSTQTNAIAYTISAGHRYKQLLIAHNFSPFELELKNPSLNQNSVLLATNSQVNLQGMKIDLKDDGQTLTIPAHQSVVIGMP